MGDLERILEELAALSIRLDNVEGHFDNFNTTLNNHMTDYKTKQESLDKLVGNLKSMFGWGFWIIFGLLLTVIAGFIAATVTLLGMVI